MFCLRWFLAFIILALHLVLAGFAIRTAHDLGNGCFTTRSVISTATWLNVLGYSVLIHVWFICWWAVAIRSYGCFRWALFGRYSEFVFVAFRFLWCTVCLPLIDTSICGGTTRIAINLAGIGSSGTFPFQLLEWAWPYERPIEQGMEEEV